jgi:hypothetical protein
MPAVTFTAAAAALGFKYRSTLYRLRDEGRLSDYLRPPASPGQAERLEMAPRGLPTLQERVSQCIRPQQTNGWGKRRPPVDPRWEGVANYLKAEVPGLEVSAAQAEKVAAALPEGLYQGWEAVGERGDGGLEWLRLAMVEAGAWWIGPNSHRHPESADRFREHWQQVGRFEPDSGSITDMFVDSIEEYDHPGDSELWQTVAKIVESNTPLSQTLTGKDAFNLFEEITMALFEIRRGARWEQGNWDRYLVEEVYIEYLDDSSGLPGSEAAKDLAQVTERGLIAPELLDKVQTALKAEDNIENSQEVRRKNIE